MPIRGSLRELVDDHAGLREGLVGFLCLDSPVGQLEVVLGSPSVTA